MRFDSFKPLRDAIENETLSLQQIGELLGAVTKRVNNADVPELEAVGADLSDASDAYEAALRQIDQRRAA